MSSVVEWSLRRRRSLSAAPRGGGGTASSSPARRHRRRRRETAARGLLTTDDDDCVDSVSGNTTTDSNGHGCGWYETRPNRCGGLDDSDFTADELCCVCGGGAASSSGDDGGDDPPGGFGLDVNLVVTSSVSGSDASERFDAVSAALTTAVANGTLAAALASSGTAAFLNVSVPASRFVEPTSYTVAALAPPTAPSAPPTVAPPTAPPSRTPSAPPRAVHARAPWTTEARRGSARRVVFVVVSFGGEGECDKKEFVLREGIVQLSRRRRATVALPSPRTPPRAPPSSPLIVRLAVSPRLSLSM